MDEEEKLRGGQELQVMQLFKSLRDEQPFCEKQREVLDKKLRYLEDDVEGIKDDFGVMSTIVTEMKNTVGNIKWMVGIVGPLATALMIFALQYFTGK